jgi:hypothetical protein
MDLKPVATQNQSIESLCVVDNCLSKECADIAYVLLA